MSNTVFVLGAGASFGDTLRFGRGYKGDVSETPPNPPLANQFFDSAHVNGESDAVEENNWELFRYIRNQWGITEPLGTRPWESLSIEDVFSSLALLHDFSPVGTNEHARSRLLLNRLTGYIRRSISLSTIFRYGLYARTLVRNLKPTDSVINFNYDLLVDQEFLMNPNALQYQNFSVKFWDAI
jgi:hypothetical protein